MTTPFLRWAGGKRWLSQYVVELATRLEFKRYFEPFLGSGAVFFSLAPSRAVLSDANKDLIETYIALKADWQGVAHALAYHGRNHSEPYYYRVRESVPEGAIARAARFIYLNRTCWNGLYRVNKSGDFNVPIGTKKNVLLATDDFELISKRLKRCKLVCSDFRKIIDRARDRDLIYVDPPYTVNHDKNGFLSYNEKIFQWDDQIRLRDALLRAKRRGAYIIVSNAHHESIRDLYKEEFDIGEQERFSGISGASKGRHHGSEYVITGGIK